MSKKLLGLLFVLAATGVTMSTPPAAGYFPPTCPAVCDSPSTPGASDGCWTSQCFRCCADFSCGAQWQNYWVNTLSGPQMYSKCVRTVRNCGFTKVETLINGPQYQVSGFNCTTAARCGGIQPDCWGYNPQGPNTLFPGCRCDSVYGGDDPPDPDGGPVGQPLPEMNGG